MIFRQRKKSAQMMAALVAGGAINGLILLIVGGITVYKFVLPEKVQLQAPPALKPLEPPTVQYNRSQTQEREKNSQRPRQQRIKTRTISNMAAPDIDIQVANFNPGVSVGDRVGQDIGSIRGVNSGSWRLGVSAVNFFGIESQGERIIIILDIARSMLDPKRGDIPGYARVKERLEAVVDELNSATLFNVMVFSNGLDVMSSDLVLANAANKQRAVEFIDPYWKADGGRFTKGAQRATFLRNYQPQYTDIKPRGGTSRMDMALLAAFEQGADAIFMITDGTPEFTREFNGSERRDYEKRFAEYEKRRSRASRNEIAKYERLRQSHQNRVDARIAAETRRRDARGLDARITEDLFVPPLPPWGLEPRNHVLVLGNDEFVEWVKSKAEQHYGRDRSSLPTLNIIGYSIEEEGHTAEFLYDLHRRFPGSDFEVFKDFMPGATEPRGNA
ncbi:MAG: hypothetical protein AAGB06_00995 [Verrucomicrobiota bacterium]